MIWVLETGDLNTITDKTTKKISFMTPAKVRTNAEVFAIKYTTETFKAKAKTNGVKMNRKNECQNHNIHLFTYHNSN